MWTTTSGSTCEIRVSAELRRDGDGEPIVRSFTVEEQRVTLAAADEFLGAFDYDAIDREAAIADFRAARGRYAAARQSLKDALAAAMCTPALEP